MKIADLKQPYRRMLEYLGRKNVSLLDKNFSWCRTNHDFWVAVDNGEYPSITAEIKKHFPPDFDFSGEEGYVYPYDKNYLKIPINEHSTLLIPKDDLMEKTTNEEKIIYWAKNLEHKSLSLYELVEEGKWLVRHCSNIEDNKQYYTQLAKEGKFDQLPDTCEFSEAVELEVSDCNEVFKTLDVVGKFKGKFIEKEDISRNGYTFWNFAKLPTPKIDFSQFKSGDVVEITNKDNEKYYGLLYLQSINELVITLSYNSKSSKHLLKDNILSITKIK